MITQDIVIHSFKVIMSIFYLFGLFFSSRRHPIFGAKQDLDPESGLNFFYKMYNLHGEWAVFTNLEGPGVDLRIEAITKKAKYEWFLNRDETIGEFRVTRGTSRALISQLYTRLSRPFLNRFLKKHLVEYFARNGDELIQLKIDSIVLDMTGVEDRISSSNRTRIKYRINPYGYGTKTSYLWKK